MVKRKKMLMIAGVLAFFVIAYYLGSLINLPAFLKLNFNGLKSNYHGVGEEGLCAFIDERAEYWPLLLEEWKGESRMLRRYSPFKSDAERAIFSSPRLECIQYNGKEFIFTFNGTYNVTIFGEEELIYSPYLPIHEIGKAFAPYELNLTLAEEKEGFLRWEEGPRYFTVKEIRPGWYWIYRYWPT